MHKNDVLHLGNKLQSSSCSTDPKVLSSLCMIYIKSIGVVKSQNSVHTSQFVENNKYDIFDTSNSKRMDGISMLSISLENINNLKKYLGPDYMEFFQHWGCPEPC